MNAKTVEGLMGASTNIRLSDTAMNVFRTASQKGDTATMERALGYAGQMVDEANKYEDKAKEGMKEDAKELKEQKAADQEKMIERRKEEQRQLEERIEKSREPEKDTVEIRADAASPESTDTPAAPSESADLPPVVYSSSGEVSSQETQTEATLSVSV